MAARIRTQKLKEPVPVEVNYDPEAEKLQENQDARDIRYVRVKVPGARLVPEAARVLLLAEDKQPDDACPVGFESAPVFPGNGEDGVVEFKLHLNDSALTKYFGGSIEQAAIRSNSSPLAFRLRVGIEKQEPSDPDNVERPGALTINLNRIKWEWHPLLFGAKGAHEKAGETVANDPIEVKMDGTDLNGFALKLTLEKRQANGEYGPSSADFTHYLAPAEHKIDYSILTPVPIPSEVKGSQRQIDTIWRTGVLEKDAPILAKLPVETTLRVRAYPGESIREHREGAAPRTQPPDLKALAVREIPLRLGLRQWRLRLVTGELQPGEPPLLLTGRPWETGFKVEFEVFDDSGEKTEYLKNAKLQWRLEADPEGKRAAAGKVLGGEFPEHGHWTTDEKGRVSFQFAPEEQNSLLFAGTENLCFHAAFNVFFPGPDGEPGKKIKGVEASSDETLPSFQVAWAPIFEVSVLKLPFFLDPAATLDLEAEPDESTAAPIALELGSQEREYRDFFARGGTLRLALKVTDPGGEPVPKFEQFLEYARVLVGAKTRAEAKPRPLDFEALGTYEKPYIALRIPAPPKAAAGETDFRLEPQLALHPEVRRVLRTVVDACAELGRELAYCPQLGVNSLQSTNREEFHRLAAKFFADAAGFLCASPREPLATKRKEIRATLGAMVPFLSTTGEIWTRLGSSIEVHRSAYKRLEAALLNFYYDFITWDKVAKPLASGWGKLRARFPWLPEDLRLNMPTDYLFKVLKAATVKSGLDALARPLLDKCLKNLKEARDRRFQALGYDLQRLGLAREAGERALRTAEEKLERSVAAVEQSIDELGALNARIERGLQEARDRGLAGEALEAAVAPLRSEQERLRSGLGRQLTETTEAMAVFEQNSKVRALTECEHRVAQAEQRIVDTAEERLQQGGQRLEEALASEEVSPTALQDIMDEARDVPVNEIARQTRDEGLAFVEDFAASRQRYADRINAKVADLSGRGGAAIAAQQPFGGPVGARAVDPAALERQIVELEAEAQRRFAATQETLAEAGRTYPARVAGVTQFYNASKAISDELISDAVKSGSHVPLEVLRTSIEEIPVPPSNGESYADTFVDFLVYCVRAVLSFFVRAGSFLLRQTYDLLAFLARGVLFFVGLLFRLTARFGAKIAEALTVLLQSTIGARGAAWPTSALTAPALEAGMAELRKAHGSADEFFSFPYFREMNFVGKMRESAQNFALSDKPADRASEQAVEDALKTGYEDYYPSQMIQARALLKGLCERALSLETLQLAPCPDSTQAAQRSFACLQAGDGLGRQIDEFMRAAAAASSDGKGFFVPLVDLVGRTEWNSASLESIADWCGWIIGWTFRIGALVLAIASWWFPPGLAISASMIAAAATVSAISAAFRIGFAACGYYPYSTAYPRDLVALQGAHYAAVFREEGERLAAESAPDFVKDYPQ